MGLKSRLRQYSNANGSLGLALAVVALVVVLIYGCLCLSGWVMAAEPIDLHARLPHLGSRRAAAGRAELLARH